jgi:hypothetical protein
VNPKLQSLWENGMLWLFAIAAPLGILSVLAILLGKAWETLRPLLFVLVLALAGCGFNPMEGDFGPIEWVPEQKTCREKVRYPDGRVNYEMRPCDGAGHDLEVLGEWRYL